MKCTQVVTALLMVAFPLVAQNAAKKKPASGAGETVKYVELKYLGKDGTNRLDHVNTAIDRLLAPNASLFASPVLNLAAIRGTPEGIAQAEEMLKRYDVPSPFPASEGPRQIQLLLYVLESAESTSTAPPGLEPALEQMRNTFGSQGFRLNETLLLQGLSGSSFTLNGTLALEGDDTRTSVFSAQYKGISYEAARKTVSVHAFEFHVRSAGSSSSIDTNLNLREGQKLILGKLTRDEKARPLFLVISTKVEQP